MQSTIQPHREVKPSHFPLIVLPAIVYVFDFNLRYITGFIFIYYSQNPSSFSFVARELSPSFIDCTIE